MRVEAHLDGEARPRVVLRELEARQPAVGGADEPELLDRVHVARGLGAAVEKLLHVHRGDEQLPVAHEALAEPAAAANAARAGARADRAELDEV